MSTADNGKLSFEIHQALYELGKDLKLSNRAIANKLGIHNTTVMKYRSIVPPKPELAPIVVPETELYQDIKKLLKKGPKSHLE